MIRFLHAADLHLGLRITRFEPKLAAKVREARFAALDNVLKKAAERKVDFLVIAGDVFDDHAVDAVTDRRAFAMLNEGPAPVFVLPGNHDPLVPGGVWDQSPWDKPGSQVHLLRQAEPVEFAQGVVLLPCPVFRKTSYNDPTSWIAGFPRAGNGADIRIGVAHGSLKIRDDLPADDHLIARHAATDMGLDYLALGHWHSRQLYQDPNGAERTAYSGVHEPMRFQGCTESRTGWAAYGGPGRQEFLDAGKGEVLHVEIRGPGDVPSIESLEVGHFIWNEEKYELASETDLARLINDVAKRPDVERRLLRLQVTGVLDAASMLRLNELEVILADRYLLGELDQSGLHLQPIDNEMTRAAGQGVLGRVLETLRQEAASAVPEQSSIAERALLLLYQLVQETR